MSSIALSFNNVDLTPIDNGDGQIWLTSTQIAKALGYKNSKSLNNLYRSNADEFTSSMTEVIETVVSSKAKGLVANVRIFSLRGCHLLAMFARTDTAKEFRAWVLDVLDKHMAQTKLPLDIQQSLNAVHAIRAIEFNKASGYGFGLNKWKGDKKVLDEAEAVITKHLQPELPNIDNKGGA
ncbi:MAG: BRO family protein [Psychrobacter sp.]